MPESGEWFSARTRPEMLTSDDPPIPTDKPELVRILPGPATAVGRATAPLRRLVGFVPSIGGRIVRVDDEPSRWQLIGMWTTGSAIVAASGLAVAAVLGGAPPALTQPFERLAVLPGIVGAPSQSDAVSPTSSGGKAAARHDVSGTSRHSSGSSGYSGYSGGSSGGSSATVVYPEDLVPGRAAVPGVSSAGASSSGGASAGTSAGAPGGGQTGGNPAPPPAGGTTAPAPDPTTAPPPVTDPTEVPTDPGTPTVDPSPPVQDPTDPPVDPSPADPTPESSPDSPPAEPPAADPPVADPTQDQPVDPPAATPEAPPATP